jgi:hypothetical protein
MTLKLQTGSVFGQLTFVRDPLSKGPYMKTLKSELLHNASFPRIAGARRNPRLLVTVTVTVTVTVIVRESLRVIIEADFSVARVS